MLLPSAEYWGKLRQSKDMFFSRSLQGRHISFFILEFQFFSLGPFDYKSNAYHFMTGRGFGVLHSFSALC